jgi:hypothetical protein
MDTTENIKGIEQLRAEALALGGSANFPSIVVDGSVTGLAGERGWMRFVRDANRHELEQVKPLIDRVLSRAADLTERRQRSEQEEAARQAELSRPLSEAERSARARDDDEILARARYRASAEGRLEAIEGVLGEILDLLSKGR